MNLLCGKHHLGCKIYSDPSRWRHGDTSGVETLQRAASSDEQLPGAGQLD